MAKALATVGPVDPSLCIPLNLVVVLLCFDAADICRRLQHQNTTQADEAQLQLIVIREAT